MLFIFSKSPFFCITFFSVLCRNLLWKLLKRTKNLPTSLCKAWFNCCSSSTSSSLLLESDPSMSKNDVTLLACAFGESCAVLEVSIFTFSRLPCLLFGSNSKCHILYCALDLEYLVSRQELQFLKPGIQSSSKQGDVCSVA